MGNSSSTTGLTTPNCYQSNISIYDIDNGTPQNIFIAYFEPRPLSTNTFTFDTFNISLYPNPSNGNFTITCKDNFLENSNLEIYNILGERLYQQKLLKNETVINLENFSKGIYIAKVTKNDIILNSKIILE